MTRVVPWRVCRERAARALGVTALVALAACGSPQPAAPQAGAPSGGAPPASRPGREPAGQASRAPVSGVLAAPRLLRCPAPGGAATWNDWVMAPDRRVCCAPRAPIPGWTAATRMSCLEAVSPGLAAEPSYIVLGVQPQTFVESVPFEPGSTRITSLSALGMAANILAHYPDAHLFALGTTRCGEAPSEAAAARLAADRVSAVRRELERLGRPASQLVTEDRAAFLRSREDLSHESALRLLDAPAVLLYSHHAPAPAKQRPGPLMGDVCLSGATATLALPAQLHGDSLTVETCHAARCAAARLALDTLGAGNSVAFALDGELSAGALFTWLEPSGPVLQVRTVIEDEATLASGDWLSLRVRVDDSLVARLEQPLKYTRQTYSSSRRVPASRLTCLQARVEGDAPPP
ncbi:hypothetical protein [Sorangium cellulosum]|uniref:hypothetical protein n=1 Tax=Sorangium cellulosum TaxID=56 RepID=UPI001331A59A|nr:hypothetical protein [Sorangium cellulosum]